MRDRVAQGWRNRPRPTNDDEFGEEDDGDHYPERRIGKESLAQFREVDVEHHHDEEEQHRDRANVNDDENHRQELRPQQYEQGGGVEEGEDQEQDRVHGVARAHHQDGSDDQNGCEHIEGDGRQNHVRIPSDQR